MITVEFIHNGYKVTVSGESANDVELDVTESRHVLSQLPPAVASRAVDTLPEVSRAVEDADVTPMGNKSSFQEIIPVTSIEKADLRGGRTAWKVRGGKYELWGVMLYPDTCTFKDNIAPTMIQNEVVSGLEALIIEQGGKKRVAAVRRKAASV